MNPRVRPASGFHSAGRLRRYNTMNRIGPLPGRARPTNTPVHPMTESDWLTCTKPMQMLEFLRGNASDRKTRLWEVACCRRIWHLMPVRASCEAVLVAERYADGRASDRDRQRARKQVARIAESATPGDADCNAGYAAFYATAKTAGKTFFFRCAAVAAGRAAKAAAREDPNEAFSVAFAAEESAQADLLRCIFGNPIRPAAGDPTWLSRESGTLLQLAEAIYEERAFDRVPMLADALEEAGCTDAAILGHCRGPGPHVRGCWVVDLLLGKQ
jgi:hypothetical protein